MKKVTKIFTAGLILFWFSCIQPNSKKYPFVSKEDTTSKNTNYTKQESTEKRKEREWDKQTDSIHFDMILKEALKIARKNSKTDYSVYKPVNYL